MKNKNVCGDFDDFTGTSKIVVFRDALVCEF